MAVNIAINGFGRIGRLAARIILTKYPELNIVAVNDITSPDNLAYLLQNDTTYRRFEIPVKSTSESLVLRTQEGEKRIKVFAQKDPALLPWKNFDVDVVLECTGHFLTKELASAHIAAGAKKVVLSAPAKSDDVQTVVIGANLEKTGKRSKLIKDNDILSNASCTTNCIAPALKVLSDNFNLTNASALTVHAYTATQVLQDGPSKKDYRDGRAAAQNAIPSKTGAARAVELVLPELKGKLGLSSLRVPVITGSMVYLVAKVQSFLGPGIPLSSEDINDVMLAASKSSLRGILEYSKDELVSSDVIQNPHSCIVDSGLTEVLDNTVKMVLWYDNEWGYANRLVELAKMVG
jgi:glyceraldehyde 3-phosphate dehydrogenase